MWKRKIWKQNRYVSIHHTHTNYSLFDWYSDLFTPPWSLTLALSFSWFTIILLVIKRVIVADITMHQIIYFLATLVWLKLIFYSFVLKSICIRCSWSMIFVNNSGLPIPCSSRTFSNIPPRLSCRFFVCMFKYLISEISSACRGTPVNQGISLVLSHG